MANNNNNNKKKQQGSHYHHHPQAASLESLMQLSMDAQVEFHKTVVNELRQIRFGIEHKFPTFRDHHHPLDWLSKSERFFRLYKVPEDQKVVIASNHIEGQRALEWLILYERTSSSSASWTHFVEQFLTHFGYGDIDGSLLRLNLKQGGGKGGVDAYITDFIRLVSRASKNWTDNNLNSFFINGLQDELRDDVCLYKPETLSEAMELARVLGLEQTPQPEKFIPKLPRYKALFMGKTRVKVLITGSTHNFISPWVLKGVEDRGLIIKEDDPLLVKSMLATGYTLTTEGRIDGAQVNLQGFKFAADFYLLPELAGCDLMLGNPWNCTLDGIRVGLNEDSFMVNGKNYQLTAEIHPPGTITQSCCMSAMAIRKSMLRSQ